MSIIVFIIILGLLILVHELGHFIMAKKVGILVEEFGFGFPPRIWSKKIGETIYSLNIIPFGGFVKLFGEEQLDNKDLESAKDLAKKKSRPFHKDYIFERAFFSKKPWQKTLVILGGVFMNTLLAILIYYFLLMANGFQSEPLPLFRPYQFRFGRQQGRVIVAKVVPNSPAALAGVSSEDIILRLRLDNKKTPWSDIKSSQQLMKQIAQLNNIPLTIEFLNLKNGQNKYLSVTPIFDQKFRRSLIGVQLIDSVIIKYQTPLEKLLSGFYHSYNMTIYNVKTIGFLIKTAYQEKKVEIVSQSVSGPIGIFSIIQDLVKTSGGKFLTNFLNILAALSLSLAIINVFPFPALDGGRLVFVFYEWIAKKPINKKVENYVNLGGFIFLIALAILVSINDIMRLLK